MSELEKLNQQLKEMQDETPKVFINKTFAEIATIKNTTQLSLQIDQEDIDAANVDLTKAENGGYTLIINDFAGGSRRKYNLKLQIGARKFLADDVSVLIGESKLEKQDNGYYSGSIKSRTHLREFSTENFVSEASFYRYVIKTTNSEIMHYIKGRPFSHEASTSMHGMLSLSISGIEINLYEVKHETQKYFIIDAVEKIDFNAFGDLCYSTMIGYGFLSGNFYQDEAYYIKAEDNKFTTITGVSYQQIRPSIITNGTANPIHAFTSGYTSDPVIQQRYGHFLEIFDEGLFSKFCTKIFDDPQYVVLLLLVIESNKTSLVLKPAGYSVALEKITNIIAEENKGLKPIIAKPLSKAFISEVKGILEKFKDRIEAEGNEDAMGILTKNIDRLNSPTNRDKLTKPFEIFNIDLNADEHAAIGNRNSFLHGRALKIEEGSEEFLEIYMNSLRLHKLVTKLILKHIGFSGHIVNHLKRNEAVFNKTIDEELFEFI